MTTEEITETVKEQIVCSPSGLSAVFVALNDNWGVKLYACQDKRDETYEMQMRCAAVGLGPQVGVKLELLEPPEPKSPEEEMSGEDFDCTYDYDGNLRKYFHYHIYGYTTEIVETVCHNVINSWKWYIDNKLHCDLIIKTLERECDFYFSDCHGMNWGRLKNGQLVPIDFGED